MLKVAAIIPTKCNVELKDVLDSLQSQSYYVFEVIIVCQCSNVVKIKALINNYIDAFFIKIIQSDERSASRAKNQGILNACGDALYFPDDDSYYDPDSTQKCVNKNVSWIRRSWQPCVI